MLPIAAPRARTRSRWGPSAPCESALPLVRMLGALWSSRGRLGRLANGAASHVLCTRALSLEGARQENARQEQEERRSSREFEERQRSVKTEYSTVLGIDKPQPGTSCTIYRSRPSFAVQAASVVFGAKATAAVLGGGYWLFLAASQLNNAALVAHEAGDAVAASAAELSGGTVNVWGPPLMIIVGAVTWAVTKRNVCKTVLQLDRHVDEEGNESIEITSMPSLPWLPPNKLTVPREACEAATGHLLTPNFFTVPGGRWYLLPMPGWASDDKAYLKILLYWRYFRNEPAPPPDESLIEIEGFGAYRPMQFADPQHAAARTVGWPASDEALQGTPFHGEWRHCEARFD
jgi:hypothetical protein